LQNRIPIVFHTRIKEIPMRVTTAQKRAMFRALHKDGCFILPNPWDIGSARFLQHLGFAALASTSTGFAWTMGKPDYEMTMESVISHLRSLCDAVDVPVNADFESGFAADPDGVATNVKLAVETGIAGVSIEDRKLGDLSNLYELAQSVERIKAARSAIDATGEDVILVARTEGLLIDSGAVTKAINKLVAFADVGADCLYAPGVGKKEDIAAMVRAVAPKPVNVLVMGPGLTAKELEDLGVRRISVGGALSLSGWGAMVTASEKLKAGSFDGLGGATSGGQLNEIFAKFS
jgi:2-methylisocitrate lyase-like PEP mutase family enzyme